MKGGVDSVECRNIQHSWISVNTRCICAHKQWTTSCPPTKYKIEREAKVEQMFALWAFKDYKTSAKQIIYLLHPPNFDIMIGKNCAAKHSHKGNDIKQRILVNWTATLI